MDLGAIQDALNDFATFGQNIGKAFQLVPKLLGGLITLSSDFDVLSGNAVYDSENASSVLSSK